MTDREIFDRDGFLKVPAIIMDPKNLYAEIPRDPNGFKLSGSIMHYPKKKPEFKKEETQVPGSFSIYNNPKYREIHRLMRRAVENILEIDLHPTYF